MVGESTTRLLDRVYSAAVDVAAAGYVIESVVGVAISVVTVVAILPECFLVCWNYACYNVVGDDLTLIEEVPIQLDSTLVLIAQVELRLCISTVARVASLKLAETLVETPTLTDLSKQVPWSCNDDIPQKVATASEIHP